MIDPALAPAVIGHLGDVATERLHLRRFAPGDLGALAEVFAEPDVWRYPYGRGFTAPETEDFLRGQLEHWDALGFGLWAASRRTDDVLIGFVGLSVPTFLPTRLLPAVEVGWRLHPSAWGQGLATEGARAALDQAFSTLGLRTVCSVIEDENDRSIRVAERLGVDLVESLVIPPNERRGEVTGLLYEKRAS